MPTDNMYLCARNNLGKTVSLLKEIFKEKTEQVQQMIKDQAKEYYENRATMQKKEEPWQSEKRLLVKDLTNALKIIDQLKIEQIRLKEQCRKRKNCRKQKDEEIRKLKTQLQKEKEKETEAQYSSEEFSPLGNPQIARPFMKAEVHYSGNTTTAPKIRKITNQLYNVKIPLIYAFDMNDSNGIEMLIGANFLRSMKGGIRIEGDEITIYKKVTRIKTSNQTEITEIAELEVNEGEFLEMNKSIYFNQEGSNAFLEQFKPVIDWLKHQGYIGKEPLKHWKKNGELCKLDIINPDITIEDRPLKHVTPAMKDSFRKHVDSLLKSGAIRPNKSRHRTMVMIINSGTTIDPVMRKEVKGKERMVFNYKSLNDNTYKDQYSLPGINMIIKRIGGAKIFSNFDLKSGFHQVAIDEESIPWTAFLVLGRLYGWLVMPFGLKNATTVFQRISPNGYVVHSNVDILCALQYFYCLNKLLLPGQGLLAFFLKVLAIFMGLQLTLITSVEDVWPSKTHFFGSFSNCSLKILLGSSKTCIFPSVLFTGSLPLIEKLSSLLAKLDIESSRLRMALTLLCLRNFQRLGDCPPALDVNHSDWGIDWALAGNV
ncbi:Orf y [Tanacetum coccineum]